VKTILKLPDFIATREKTSYVSTPINAQVNSMNGVMFGPFQEIDNSQVIVVNRGGHELLANGKKLSASSKELMTVGEFGPILVTVFNDLAKATVVWGHWEQGATGVLAVFRYSVPQLASHYMVSFLGMTTETRHYPAYHGEIALDPSSGAIIRLTAIAELDPNDAMSSAYLSVEYGPTEIGEMTYICPAKSVALGTIRNVNLSYWGTVLPTLGNPKKYLNEVRFTHYHVFRSDMRILPGSTQN
jgi:hypothetical protein